MEAKISMHAHLLVWAALTTLLSQNLQAIRFATPALDFEDEKNFYFTPDPPSARTPPTVSYTPPSHGSGGGHVPTTPTPSHPGGTPPATVNCGTPPSGAHHHPTPTPSKGGGSGPYYPSPQSPSIVAPPTTPSIAVPSPPSPPFDPKSPPFTCTYWKTHPGLIVGVFGWWGTVGSAFGVSSLHGYGEHMDLMQALSNTRRDGFGELYRQGTAALLNSMAHMTKFPYSTEQVRDGFVAALTSSNKAAEAQALLFKMANEGRIKSGA